MLKVFMTADAQGGVWQYSTELAGALAERGVSVVLAVLGSGLTDAKRAEARRIPNVQLEEFPCKLEWMESPWRDVEASGNWLLELASRFAPDIIHLNGYAHGLLAWNAPVLVVAHSCVLSWFDAVRDAPAPETWKVYREAVRKGLEAADLVVAPSGHMLELIEKHYGKLNRKRVIYNGRDPQSFRSAAKEDCIFAAGRVWDDAKNFRVLDAAAQNVDWPIYLAGDSAGSDLARLRLLGSLESPVIADWYARAAIYASPALYEPFGLSVLEAALSNCALLLSDIPSFREIWGDVAVYVDPADPNAWRDQLNNMVRNASERQKRGLLARGRALQFNTNAMTHQYLQAYKQATDYRTCASFSSAIPSDLTGTTGMPISSAA